MSSYKCECSECGCGEVFVNDVDFSIGDDLRKHNISWNVIHPKCTKKVGLFPVFFDPKNRFVLVNMDRSIGGCLAY